MGISNFKPSAAALVLASTLFACDGENSARHDPQLMAASESDALTDASAAKNMAGNPSAAEESPGAARPFTPDFAHAGARAETRDSGQAIEERALDAVPERAADASQASEAAPEPQQPTKPPAWAADCEMRHVFLAHGASSSGDTSKYVVPAGAQYNRTFYFARPWTGDVQVLRIRSLVDNRKIVHHWMLHTVDDQAVADGEIRGGGNGTFEAPDLSVSVGIFQAGPGSSDLAMPEGIGLRLPQAPAFALEVHYFNTSETAEEDRTGVEVCVTTKKRSIEAAAHLLGRANFRLPARQRTDVTSVCRPQLQQGDIHLISVTPHMHLAGRSFKLILNRNPQVTIFDEPYVFQEQRTYDLPVDASGSDVVMKPGDTLTSVCTYENESDAVILSGSRNQDEMCQPIVVAWPAGALSNGLFPTALVPGSAVTCMEP
jgi:hypothetical protein